MCVCVCVLECMSGWESSHTGALGGEGRGGRGRGEGEGEGEGGEEEGGEGGRERREREGREGGEREGRGERRGGRGGVMMEGYL